MLFFRARDAGIYSRGYFYKPAGGRRDRAISSFRCCCCWRVYIVGALSIFSGFARFRGFDVQRFYANRSGFLFLSLCIGMWCNIGGAR